MNPKYLITLISFVITLYLINTFILDKGGNSVVKVSQPAQSSGEALIGGTFELIDQDGNKFTQEDIKGKYSLVFFGFTHCPMICPTTLSNISLAFDKLGDRSKQFKVVFITTDPERDIAQRLKEYLSAFPVQVTGLTGDEVALKKVQELYKVYAEKLPADASGNYDMNHSAIVYIMDKQGKFLSHFSSETKVDDIVSKLNALN